MADSNPQEIVIEATDFAFITMPDTILSGLSTVRLKNSGAFPHHAILVKIPSDHTYDEYVGFIKNNMGKSPQWATMVGGPNASLSGESVEATVDLEPGNYAVVCAVPVPAEQPHFMKGMIRPLTVLERKKTSSEDPRTDITIAMNDYSFTVTPKIKAGTKTIRVENTGSQPHEFLLVRLDEDKEMKDVIDWLGQIIARESGPLPQAPGTFLNGVGSIDNGAVNYITVDFTPGRYALICPIPDVKDGKPHFAHGMMQQFTVAAESN